MVAATNAVANTFLLVHGEILLEGVYRRLSDRMRRLVDRAFETLDEARIHRKQPLARQAGVLLVAGLARGALHEHAAAVQIQRRTTALAAGAARHRYAKAKGEWFPSATLRPLDRERNTEAHFTGTNLSSGH